VGMETQKKETEGPDLKQNHARKRGERRAREGVRTIACAAGGSGTRIKDANATKQKEKRKVMGMG